MKASVLDFFNNNFKIIALLASILVIFALLATIIIVSKNRKSKGKANANYQYVNDL